MRPSNPLGLFGALNDEWSKTAQPLRERGIPGQEDLADQGLLSLFSVPALANTIAPVGTYEDGSVGLAWPKILAAPAEGMANFGRYGYDTPEAIQDNARSAFDVAGGAMTGSLGVGMLGGFADDAVKAVPHPMDEAIANLRRAVAESEAKHQAALLRRPKAVSGYGLLSPEGVRRMDADPEYFNSYLTTDLSGAVGQGSPILADASQMGRLSRERAEGSFDLREPEAAMYQSDVPGVAALPNADRLASPSGISLDYADILNSLQRPTYLNANATTGAAIPLAGEGQGETELDPAIYEYLRLMGGK